jgi:hypothetical protein
MSVCFYVGLLHSVITIVSGLNITDPPQDTVVLVGSSINLTCGTQDSDTEFFLWGQYSGNQLVKVYSTRNNGPPSHGPSYTASKFPQVGLYGLGINNIMLADGGRYGCSFPDDSVSDDVNVLVVGESFYFVSSC